MNEMNEPRKHPPLMRCTRGDCEMVESSRAQRPDGVWVLSFFCGKCICSGGFTCKIGGLASGVTIRRSK